jgi:rhamnosyl/mannosyltransferase
MIGWLRKHAAEYDLIHVHHPDPMACLALRLSGYKGRVILHWHSDILKKKAVLAAYKPLQSWLIRRAERIVGTTPVYVALSKALADVQDKVTYVPIGIDPIVVDSAKAAEIQARYPGKKIVYSLGRLVPYKGYTYLIQAAAYLPEDYIVLIGGTGPLKESLQAEIDVQHLQEKVKLLGFIADEEHAALYGAAKVFVMSSVMKTEAFGIVQIEAMSTGTPVVATKIPESGVSWVNEDGVSGLNVEPEDPKALAEAIRAICENEERYATFSQGARERFKTLYQFDKMIKKIITVYENKA